MVELRFPHLEPTSHTAAELLFPGELVAVVDDSPEIVLLLSQYLKNQGFEVVTADSAGALYQLIAQANVALVLLDIGLPDQLGSDVLKDIAGKHPDLAIIMVTGTTDIQVALECLRQGADDYLTKPVSIEKFNYTVENTLKKRQLVINNRRFQQELQKANKRMRFLHTLTQKMNTAYLNTVELQGILRAILVGITSEDGLRFNRAFLALYNEQNTHLEGKLAIGPASKEEAGRVWHSIKQKGLQLEDILDAIQEKTIDEDIVVNNVIKTLRIPSSEQNHVLISASRKQQTIRVVNGVADDNQVPAELIDTLGESSFAVVPLFSPEKSLGVIIVDNFVTGQPISDEDISGLEIFASQASIAIEHSHLYAAMAKQIAALETVTEELEKSKNLLVEAERTTAIGEMSAQLLHAIRNPLTSIGGTSRILKKKIADNRLRSYLDIITDEASKIETIMDDLFSFVADREMKIESHDIHSLIRKSVMIFYPSLKHDNIEYQFHFKGEGRKLSIDENKIRQVFVQLIRNAMEAMPNGGLLGVSVTEDDRELTVTIADTGAGIPEETMPLVKNPFFTTKTYGNGLGLAIAEKIITAHQGRLVIRGNPAGGTEAMVILPLPSPSND